MPKGFRTHGGSHEDWARQFYLRESPTASWRARTFVNVIDAQATLRIAEKFGSPGMLTALDAIVEHNRPYVDVLLFRSAQGELSVGTTIPMEFEVSRAAEVKRICDWISERQICVLNVAGNAEQQSCGIERFAQSFLVDVFRALSVDR